MPRQRPRKGTKTNGKKRSAWTPQRRGSPEAWMEKLGYTPAALRCRTLADMTEEEIIAIELEYGVPVIRPGNQAPTKPVRRLLDSGHEATQDWW